MIMTTYYLSLETNRDLIQVLKINLRKNRIFLFGKMVTDDTTSLKFGLVLLGGDYSTRLILQMTLLYTKLSIVLVSFWGRNISTGNLGGLRNCKFTRQLLIST